MDKHVFHLKKLYLCGSPIEKLIGQCTDWNDNGFRWQQQLLDVTVRNPLSKKYSVGNFYKKAFLKSLIVKLESNGVEVCEELYVAYTDMISLEMPESEHYYRIYCIDPELDVIIEENRAIVSGGTTGLVTWQAAKALSEWCLNNVDRLNGRNVLELGCGIGLTGILVCKLCQPKTYIFTDYHPKVLDVLRHNLSINLNEIKERSTPNSAVETLNDVFEWKSSRAYVKPFHWDDEEALQALVCHDIILAADVVYDCSIISCFVSVMKHLLENKDGVKKTAYVACTLRNSETLNRFYDELRSSGLNYDAESLPTLQIFQHDLKDICSVVLVKITSGSLLR